MSSNESTKPIGIRKHCQWVSSFNVQSKLWTKYAFRNYSRNLTNLFFSLSIYSEWFERKMRVNDKYYRLNRHRSLSKWHFVCEGTLNSDWMGNRANPRCGSSSMDVPREWNESTTSVFAKLNRISKKLGFQLTVIIIDVKISTSNLSQLNFSGHNFKTLVFFLTRSHVLDAARDANDIPQKTRTKFVFFLFLFVKLTIKKMFVAF